MIIISKLTLENASLIFLWSMLKLFFASALLYVSFATELFDHSVSMTYSKEKPDDVYRIKTIPSKSFL